MKDNKYTQFIGKVKVSDDVLENALQNAKNSIQTSDEHKGKVIIMKSKFINIKTAAAALLVLAVGIGALFAGNYFDAGIQPIKNTFTLTANAQELSYDTKVLLYENDEFEQYGEGHGYFDDGSLFTVVGIEFPFYCEGDDVESVTYSLNPVSPSVGMEFVLSEEYSGVISYEQTPYGNGIENWVAANGETKDLYSKEYTVSYENQPRADSFVNKNEMLNRLETQDFRKTPPVLLSIGFHENPVLPDGRSISDYSYDRYTDDLKLYDRDAYVYYFEKHGDEMKAYITVNFKDGTSDTRVLQLYCEPDEDGDMGLRIYGMLVE